MPTDRTSQHIATAVALVIVLYLASPPFVLWAVERTHSLYLLGRPFEIFYAPAGWLYEHLSPYHSYISTLLRVLNIPG
ncbi:hypothetical protein BH09VER1_BH09VER1_43290 [soil metagenome]